MDIEHWNVLLQHSQLRQCMGVLCTSVKLLTDLRISAVNCTKCVWRPGSTRTRWGSYSVAMQEFSEFVTKSQKKIPLELPEFPKGRRVLASSHGKHQIESTVISIQYRLVSD